MVLSFGKKKIKISGTFPFCKKANGYMCLKEAT